jgi:hypothetical protein
MANFYEPPKTRPIWLYVVLLWLVLTLLTGCTTQAGFPAVDLIG